jgi:hypothetical protein
MGKIISKGAKTKEGGRYAEPWVPVQEGRERPLAWLDRGNSAGRDGYRPGVPIWEMGSHYHWNRWMERLTYGFDRLFSGVEADRHYDPLPTIHAGGWTVRQKRSFLKGAVLARVLRRNKENCL